MGMENLEIPQEDGEFGAPESIEVDMNSQINHLMSSVTNNLAQLHWKIGQHAAEIDTLKQALLEKNAECEGWKKAADHYAEEMEKLKESVSVEFPQQDEFRVVGWNAEHVALPVAPALAPTTTPSSQS